MKAIHGWLGFILLVILCWFATTAAAQEEPMSPEEIKQLMNGISAKMKQIEQMLAKASLKPEDLALVLEQLRDAAANKNYAQLPPTLREFLLNNPDLLAKLKSPEKSGDDLLRTEDEIRRLLATDDDGLEKLLSSNPEILERLMQEQSRIEEALREHSRLQNDLDRLFGQTKDQMQSTEDDIKKLMDLAQQMQQKMDQQAQKQSDPNRLPDQQGESQRPNNNNENLDNPNSANDLNDNKNEGSENSRRAPGEMTDREAWEAILPQTDVPPSIAAARRRAPEQWEAEAESYFKMLAQQAVEERRRREHQKRENR